MESSGDLPVGYRFSPTDEELMIHFLGRKCFGFKLPYPIIPEFDVFNAHPQNVPGDMHETRRYFFTRRRMNNENSGQWKPTGKEKPIIASINKKMMGTMRILVYTEAENSCPGFRWFIHEYGFAGHAATQIAKRGGKDWVVCCLLKKKKKAKRGQTIRSCNSRESQNLYTAPDCFDIMVEDGSGFGPPLPSSPSCCDVSEDICSKSDQEDICSSG